MVRTGHCSTATFCRFNYTCPSPPSTYPRRTVPHAHTTLCCFRHPTGHARGDGAFTFYRRNILPRIAVDVGHLLVHLPYYLPPVPAITLYRDRFYLHALPAHAHFPTAHAHCILPRAWRAFYYAPLQADCRVRAHTQPPATFACARTCRATFIYRWFTPGRMATRPGLDAGLAHTFAHWRTTLRIPTTVARRRLPAPLPLQAYRLPRHTFATRTGNYRRLPPTTPTCRLPTRTHPPPLLHTGRYQLRHACLPPHYPHHPLTLRYHTFLCLTTAPGLRDAFPHFPPVLPAATLFQVDARALPYLRLRFPAPLPPYLWRHPPYRPAAQALPAYSPRVTRATLPGSSATPICGTWFVGP